MALGSRLALAPLEGQKRSRTCLNINMHIRPGSAPPWAGRGGWAGGGKGAGAGPIRSAAEVAQFSVGLLLLSFLPGSRIQSFPRELII